jgi:hypothetical protein
MTLGTSPVPSGSSAGDPLAAAREHAGQLATDVEQIHAAYGNTLGVRRLRSDVHRLLECLDELGPPMPGHHAPEPVARVRVPGEPYDESMWSDAETEGLGGLGRRTR